MAEKLRYEASGAGFEHEDLSPRGVFGFLAGLAAAVIVLALLLWGLYRAMDAYQRKNQPAQSPMAAPTAANTRQVSPNQIRAFPQPRLEPNERVEINQFRLEEEQHLASYGWVDQEAGVVRIPIERAMQLIAERGLPTTPRVGTAPSSEVSVVKQAAERSDTSNLPRAKGKKQ